MGSIFLIMVILLVALAVSDLIVGVSNDAVNFLNASIGSKVASFKTIMIVASIGILFGATFSSGMMEVARKGIFHPNLFNFNEIMFIFLAVMVTDIILLDTFNTFGFPTSTTVSIVFELLGAAVAMSLIKISADTTGNMELSNYINSAKALAIISGILVSVVVAFTTGLIFQFISRLIFSFEYEKKLKYYGPIWGGLAIAAITYFILIKGVKGASFMSPESKDYIKHHAFTIISTSIVAWTIILGFFSWLMKLDILKFIVFIGTFALAMAFAGNDLVNFIGVPLAGLQSYNFFVGSGTTDAGHFLMTQLSGPVHTPTLYLLLAGLVMVLTLALSKKARSVTKTTIDLSRQDEGNERFGSSFISRTIVRAASGFSNTVNKTLPNSILKKIEKQFDQKEYNKRQRKLGKDAPSFDMLRASVTLVVASILIAIGTSYKLPLSTTYVTFMVAMGTSLADGAWGRESAVYRISGVLSVIGGWFFTAFSAFTVAFIFAYIFYYGGTFAVIIMIPLIVFFLYKTHLHHAEQTAEQEVDTDEIEGETISDSSVLDKSVDNVTGVLVALDEIFKNSLDGLATEDLKKLTATYKDFTKVDKRTKKLKNKVSKTIDRLNESSIETGHFYVQVLDYLRQITHNSYHITRPILMHVDNNHKPLLPVQNEELQALYNNNKALFSEIITMIKSRDFSQLPQLITKQEEALKFVKVARKNQIKRIKNNEVGTRNSMLYLNLLSEAKNMIIFAIDLVKSFRDFFKEN